MCDAAVVVNQYALQLNGTSAPWWMAATRFTWTGTISATRLPLLRLTFSYDMRAYTAEGMFAYDHQHIKIV